MGKNRTTRLFPALVATLLAITLLAAGAAAWLRWGGPRPDTTAGVAVAATATPGSVLAASPSPPPTGTPTPSPTATAEPVEATDAPPDTPTATATPRITEYTVVEGDTLVGIAARFGVSADELANLNNLDDPDQIAVDQVLILPGGATTGGDTATATTAAPGAATTAPGTRAPGATPATPPGTAARPPLGQSFGGRPIEHYRFGAGPVHLLFVGAIHGGYEWNTANLAYLMVDYFQRNPGEVPGEVTLHIVPVANPDGLARVSPGWETGPIPTPAGVITDTYSGRFNDRDVDLNRNWDCNWQPTALWRDQEVDAGQAPFSEPEVRLLRDFILEQPMTAVVFWHSAAGAVLPGACAPDTLHAPSRELGEVYAGASRYELQDALFYEISGDASDWLTTQGIPSVAVEFFNHSAMDWQENLAGTLAVLDHYAAICAAEGCAGSDR